MNIEPVLPEDMDLNAIFIGRERQLNDFRVYLGNWKRSLETSSTPPLNMPPTPVHKIPGFFVLLHGRGGIGKSMLLNHYHTIALEETNTLLVGNIIDWETAAKNQRELFQIKEREEVDAYKYFHLLASRLAAIALHKNIKEFSAYRAAEQAANKAKKTSVRHLGSTRAKR